jgi:magnesium transporter
VFLGEITADSILTILHKEMHEDSLRRAGIGHSAEMKSAIFTLPIHTSIRHRIPWLILGLLGGLLAAKVIGFFEEILSENLILAAFIPLIVYMSDAVGTQMEAYIIRDLALEGSLPFGKYLARHLLIVFCIAAIIAALLMGAYSLMTSQIHLAAVLSIALFIAILSSVCTGLIIPYLVRY